MKKSSGWKKSAALLMSMALVTGAMPANLGGLIKEGTGIIAKADDEVAELKVGAFIPNGAKVNVPEGTYFGINDYYPAVVSTFSGEAVVNAPVYSEGQYGWEWTNDDGAIALYDTGITFTGVYLTSDELETAPAGFYVISGDGSEEKPYVFGLEVPKFISKNVTLTDDLGLNFIIDSVTASNIDALSVKFTGKCVETEGEIVSKTINGQDVYCATANVAAKNMDSEIKAELYLEDAKISETAFSVNSYLDQLNTAATNEKLVSLVNATKQYGAVSSAYFYDSALPTVADHKDDINNATFWGEWKAFEPQKSVDYINRSLLESSEVGLSLVLDSKLTLRLYPSDINEEKKLGVEVFGNESSYYTADAVAGANDKYCFEIPGITPTQLGQLYDLNYTGTHFFLSPMSWAYRVVNAEAAPEKDVAMANALYEYYTAATEFAK